MLKSFCCGFCLCWHRSHFNRVDVDVGSGVGSDVSNYVSSDVILVKLRVKLMMLYNQSNENISFLKAFFLFVCKLVFRLRLSVGVIYCVYVEISLDRCLLLCNNAY